MRGVRWANVTRRTSYTFFSPFVLFRSWPGRLASYKTVEGKIKFAKFHSISHNKSRNKFEREEVRRTVGTRKAEVTQLSSRSHHRITALHMQGPYTRTICFARHPLGSWQALTLKTFESHFWRFFYFNFFRNKNYIKMT